jgi:signal transduction histidine kinase/CheY-like chemotaxis protein/HPt (histidine-containing phosphotransfer) domain-containing protein/ferredoxin
MEMANITYQDEAGNIKVKINREKCISCGRCVSACKHDARYYVDDTEQFFDDLRDGIPISIIAAPSIRTNIPDYKKLFTYFKRIGVNKIYDVSLGADICIWAHIRYIEKNKPTPIITQPCPAIVTYCEMYHHDLLPRLSPVHSPMACTSVYLKNYQGVNDRIAALSPCTAKKNEFEDTRLVQYNITFAKLLEYLEKNNITLPDTQTEFEHDESGLGSLFPTPGGLKENIEYYMGGNLHIATAEGFNVYQKIDKYAQTPPELLPEIFDVLNCIDGCNIGPACSRGRNVFEIEKKMHKKRKRATSLHKKEYYVSLYKKYDDTFDFSHFIRKYQPIPVSFPQITDADIQKAFELLGKNNYEKQNVNCGACGSETCYDMARKIALNVNIPINCLVKSMEDAKTEHAENLQAHSQLANIEQMREADERMRVMLDATPIGAYLWDKNRKLIDCNQEIVRIFNLTDKKECLEKFYGLMPEYQSDGILSRDKVMQMVNQAFEKGFLRLEFMHQLLDGEAIPVEVTLVRINYKGEDHVAAYLRDLREQKRMMQEIATAQITTAAMFGTNPQINVLFNADFNVIDCNPIAVSFMGFETKEAMLAGFIELVTKNTPDFQPDGQLSLTLIERLTIAVTNGHAKYETDLLLHGVNRTLEVELKKIPYENSFAIVAYIYDITDIRKRENELARAHEQNQLQLTQLNLVVRASKIGLWDMVVVQDDPVNPSNPLIYSDELRQMTGCLDKNEFPDILGTWAKILHPDDRERVINAFAKHLLDTTGKTPFDVEYQMLKKNGGYGYYHAAGETIRDKNGNPLRIAGSLFDITETKNILLDTERQRVEAEAANKAKTAFLSTMSHEIRTPMNAILGITEIQLQNDLLDPDVKEALEKIYTSGDILMGIINDILDLSKIESGKMELFITKYDITSLVSDIVQLNILSIGGKPIVFDLYMDENMPVSLLGDEHRVKQILNNLLSNAFKYSMEGTVELSVSAEPVNGEENKVILVFTVSDTGQGMTKEQIDILFDEYSRFNLEANRSTEGTGLGMSITNNLIHLMNGEILIESEPGKGSVFTVRLPQDKVGNAVLGREIAENMHRFRASGRAQMKRVKITREPMPYGSVLLVDDVETNIYVASGLLSPYQVKIDSAISGAEAVEKIKNGNVYDIIFMDHMMPKMDGIEATKIIRGMGYTRPIVALTANAVRGQADIFLGSGFDDYITKPIDIRQLNAALNKLIRDIQPPEVIEAARKNAVNEQAPDDELQPLISPNLAEVFTRDAVKVLAELERVFEQDDYNDKDNMRAYIISVHGIKNALASVGKTDLSATALKLEKAGREEKIDIIKAETPAFIESLRAVIEEIRPKKGKSIEKDDEDKPRLTTMLMAIKAACEDYDEKAADKVLAELRKTAWSQQTNELLGKIAEQLLHSNFDEVADDIDKFLEKSSFSD